MQIVKIVAGLLLALALVVLVVAPIGPLPGVFIGGTPTPAPATWQDTSGIDEIRLKAPGAIPRVVIIWVIDVAGELYVVGMKESGWVRRIGDGAPVELRIRENTYVVEAVPVTEGAAPIYEAYLAKYAPNYPDLVAQLPPIETAADVAVMYRLDRG
ncbi:MAG: hypothetical protein AAGC67_11135 [Myxococcota bacterium]